MEMKLKMNEKIKILRKMNDLTQEQMAEKLHLSRNAYSEMERGKVKKVPHEKIEQMLKVFDMDYLEFLSIGEEGKLCFIGEKSVVNIGDIGNVGDNSSINSITSTTDDQETAFELAKMKLLLAHKDETIEHLKEKIQSLEEIISLLKK